MKNAYPRVVTYEGNRAAQAIIQRVFQPVDRNWRGIGTIPLSGWGLRPELADFDAEKRFDVSHIQTRESDICIAGQILQGLKKPVDCPAFGTPARPKTPWARRWFPPKAPARHSTATAAEIIWHEDGRTDEQYEPATHL